MFASAGKPALLLVYHLASHLAGGRGPSARFVEAFETEDWAPEAVLIMMNATAAAAAFEARGPSGAAPAAALEARWTSLHEAVRHGDWPRARWILYPASSFCRVAGCRVL